MNSKAYYEGARAGSKLNVNTENPYHGGSQEWWDWDEGYCRASDLALGEDEIEALSPEAFDALVSHEEPDDA